MVFVLIALVLTLVVGVVMLKIHKGDSSEKLKYAIPVLLLCHLVNFTFMFMGYSMVEEYDKFTVNYSKNNALYEEIKLSSGMHYIIRSNDNVYVVPSNKVEVVTTDDPEKAWVTVKGSRVLRAPRYELLYKFNTLDEPRIENVYHVEHVDIIKYQENNNQELML